MPTEKAPKFHTITHGDKKWKIDHEEMRKREATVDENGVRHTPLIKDPGNPSQEAVTVAHYRSLGYEVHDQGYQIDFTIPQSIYLEREAAMHKKANTRLSPRKDTELASDGIDAGLEVLQNMRPEDFATADL